MNFLHVQMDTGQQTASVVRTNRPALRHHRRALPRKRLDERRGRDALLDAVQEFGERVVRTGGHTLKKSSQVRLPNSVAPVCAMPRPIAWP